MFFECEEEKYSTTTNMVTMIIVVVVVVITIITILYLIRKPYFLPVPNNIRIPSVKIAKKKKLQYGRHVIMQ